ncbi:MAG: glycerophosphodiester phosphodiesterase [Promethearchaeota archaeon]
MKGKSIFGRPHVLAHRMLVPGYPENTIISLKKAIEIGVDWIEFDVKILKDGNLVSVHDNLLDRTTDGHGPVSEKTLEEIKKLNAGKNYNFGFVPVPTVDEILSILSKSQKFIRAEMHMPGLLVPENLTEKLDKYGVRDRCYFNHNSAVVAEYMREDLEDNISLFSLNVQADSPELKDICINLDLSYLCVSTNALNEEFVRKIHGFRKDKPVFVHCYPVNNEKEWERMIEIGVDVIQTDFPDALIQYLKELGFDIDR